jgi:hypothetical protein
VVEGENSISFGASVAEMCLDDGNHTFFLEE